MPKQIHQGVGSLSERARRMFMGGEVSGGGPLASYQQYLTQTYAQPIQQSAQQAVGQFVDSVRQKEQQYFGGGMGSPMQGGLMGSPMQPGNMQMAQHSAQQPPMPQPDPGGSMRGFGVMQPGTFTVPGSGATPQGAMIAGPFGDNLNQQQTLGQLRLDGMQPSSAAINQANLAAAQSTAPSAAPGMTISDAFASKFGENWEDQFSLLTPNNRPLLGIV